MHYTHLTKIKAHHTHPEAYIYIQYLQKNFLDDLEERERETERDRELQKHINE